MNLVDKLLLGLLVILLPLGIVATQFILSSKNDVKSENQQQIDPAKLEQLIQQAVNQNQNTANKPAPFNIISVTYASESGVLKFRGSAPDPKASVMVSATVLPKRLQGTPSPEPSGKSLVKGSLVETVSVQPEFNGQFLYEREISKEESSGVIEMRLVQNDSITTVRFDLEKKQQIL